jgi:gamma-butyrobetaine dioxygenase
MQPVRLPFDQAEAMYAAYRAWAEMVARPEFALRLRLAPGDCLIFDNTRILHARTAFSSSSSPAPASASGPMSASPPAPGPDASTEGEPPPHTGAPVSAERHLQGCYADLDGLLSTLAVLRRQRDH